VIRWKLTVALGLLVLVGWPAQGSADGECERAAELWCDAHSSPKWGDEVCADDTQECEDCLAKASRISDLLARAWAKYACVPNCTECVQHRKAGFFEAREAYKECVADKTYSCVLEGKKPR